MPGRPVGKSGSFRRKAPEALAASGAAEALSQSLPALIVRAERLAAAISFGQHGRHKAGNGQDFWQFHRYRPGDDTGAIDWRQSARSPHLFVRERESESAQTVMIWRDGAPTMRYGSGQETKLERASLLMLALCQLLIRGGERAGIYGTPAITTGRAGLIAIARALTAPPQPEALPPAAPVARHAQFVWTSDFLSPLDEIEATIRRLLHEGVRGRLVHIIDPAEEDFPFTGRTRFEAADGSETRLLGRAESLRVAYRQRFAARAETLGALARHLGWNYIAHRTDQPARTALIALYADLNDQPLPADDNRANVLTP